jgi:hypothetical protein
MGFLKSDFLHPRFSYKGARDLAVAKRETDPIYRIWFDAKSRPIEFSF